MNKQFINRIVIVPLLNLIARYAVRLKKCINSQLRLSNDPYNRREATRSFDMHIAIPKAEGLFGHDLTSCHHLAANEGLQFARE
jgi:hypothetical protein